MDYEIHFPNPSFGALVHDLEHTRLGNAVVAGFAVNFNSVSDLISGSHFDGGGGTAVNLPNGNTLDFNNVPRGRFAAVVRTVGAYFGFQQ